MPNESAPDQLEPEVRAIAEPVAQIPADLLTLENRPVNDSH